MPRRRIGDGVDPENLRLESIVEAVRPDSRDPMEILQEVEEQVIRGQRADAKRRRSMAAKMPGAMNLGKVSIGRLRVKMSDRPDSDGDIHIAATAPVDNLTSNLLEVTLYFQGLDADGFEVETMKLEGLVPAGARSHSLSDTSSWVKATAYKRISLWQLRKFFVIEK